MAADRKDFDSKYSLQTISCLKSSSEAMVLNVDPDEMQHRGLDISRS